jgi:predicted TIM-barrel fold metal-dependent hydrolase
MIVDVHGHLAHEAEDLDAIVEQGEIRQAWIHDISFHLKSREVQPASPAEMLEVARRYPGFFIPFAFLDFTQPPEIVDRHREAGFLGLKAIRPLHPYDHEGYFPHYARAEALGMPILFHTGVVSGATREMLAEGVSTNTSRMRPAYLMGVAAAFPRLTLIAAHLGVPWGEETYTALRVAKNLYTDLSGGMNDFKLRWLDRYLHRGVAGQVLMGIDATYGRARYHQDILMMVRFWELYFDVVLKPSDVYRHKDAIFHATAQALAARHFGR